jgi:hypothetical protein
MEYRRGDGRDDIPSHLLAAKRSLQYLVGVSICTFVLVSDQYL